MNLSNQVYLIDGARTPIGSPFKSLKTLTVGQMASVVVAELLNRNKIPKDRVNEVILGNTVAAGSGQNFARQVVFLAGIPLSTPAYVVNQVCGSGLQAVIQASRAVLLKEADLVVAGGAESASRTPYLFSKDANTDHPDWNRHTPVDSLVYDGLWCLLTGKHMGELCESLAERYQITRQQQDLYALGSHLKASRARKEGKFVYEIVPIAISKNRIFFEDERPRRIIFLDKFQELPAAFKAGGTITAGNSSIPSDGAGAVLVASEALVKEHGISPMARLLGQAVVATEPELVFAVGIKAIETCLQRCRLSVEDIDLFEISEAFAAQVILTRDQLKIPQEKVNIFGGDIALGHPLGAAGTRALVTLLHALRDQGKRRGLVCVCLGGGGAIALCIERVG